VTQQLQGKVEPMLRRQALCALVGMSKSTIYKMMAEGKFPRPVRMGPVLVAWRASDVAAWQRSCQTTAAGFTLPSMSK
jgi:prophage regulatory protein